MSSTDSSSRPSRSENFGQSWPVAGTSLSDSPVPTPSHTRSSARQASVANAWATTAGCMRYAGAVTDVPSRTRSVRAATAPSQTSAFGEWPPLCRNGWKWSETATLSSPTASARTARSSRRPGGNCSAEALYPSSITGPLRGRCAATCGLRQACGNQLLVVGSGRGNDAGAPILPDPR